jgi:hypothetical protein
MTMWIQKINTATGGGSDVESSPARAHTLPSGVDPKKDESKKRGFFTLGKKK